MEHVVIIGNGISGVTAARHIRKISEKKITIISIETEHFFSRTALMYIYMGHMTYENTKPYEDHFWKKNEIDLLRDFVTEVDPKNRVLHLATGRKLSFDILVIATGSKSNKFGWPGQDLEGVQGLYSMPDLDLLEQNTQNINRAVIVGGGLIGIELAEMLHTRNIPVTFLVREKNFWNGVLPLDEAQLIDAEIRRHHIDLQLSTNLKAILPDPYGRVKAVTTDTGLTIECQMVGLTPGVSPNIDFLRGSGIELGRGVKVNRFLETNIKDIYAIGDCAEQLEGIGLRRPIEAVWYTGRMMGETAAQTICGNRWQYKPGHWFNSAKFFDIEYQTYGWVWANPKDYEEQFYWQHQDGKKAIRISYEKDTREFLGINTFGIRMKHEFFDKMLTEKQSVDYVVANLREANFDPEFFSKYEGQILGDFKKTSVIL